MSGFRPPALPFSHEGWIVAADELAVRECLYSWPGPRDTRAAGCVEAEKGEELREREALGEESGVDERI